MKISSKLFYNIIFACVTVILIIFDNLSFTW